MATEPATDLYPYNVSHALAAVFSNLVGLSLCLHIWQSL
jgi:hypothetical protein